MNWIVYKKLSNLKCNPYYGSFLGLLHQLYNLKLLGYWDRALYNHLSKILKIAAYDDEFKNDVRYEI